MALFYPHYNGFVISNLDISSCCARPLYSTVTKPAPGPLEFQVLSELSGGGTKEVRSTSNAWSRPVMLNTVTAICIYIYLVVHSVVFSAVLLESQLGIAGVGGRYPQMQKKTDMDRFPHSTWLKWVETRPCWTTFWHSFLHSSQPGTNVRTSDSEEHNRWVWQLGDGDPYWGPI